MQPLEPTKPKCKIQLRLMKRGREFPLGIVGAVIGVIIGGAVALLVARLAMYLF